MMKDTTPNMAEELFIEKLHSSPVYYVVGGAKEEAHEILQGTKSAEEKTVALPRVLAIYFSQKNYLDAFLLVESLINDPIMSNHRAYLLFQQGRISEFLYEFNDALIYYCRSLTCPMIPDEIYYDLWNSMGFCWLYKQDIKSAEICCRRAIGLDMNRWEGWKNLAVSLEHQGYCKESMRAYIKAVGLSRGNEVTVLHLWRFDKRHPKFLPDQSIIKQDIYREYSILL